LIVPAKDSCEDCWPTVWEVAKVTKISIGSRHMTLMEDVVVSECCVKALDYDHTVHCTSCNGHIIMTIFWKTSWPKMRFGFMSMSMKQNDNYHYEGSWLNMPQICTRAHKANKMLIYF
jgi:hypothetical protein